MNPEPTTDNSSLQTWRAFAKVNLELRILGRRPDGYHELRTVMQTVGLADEIQVRPSDAFRFSASAGPEDETNLVVRAVRIFERETGAPVRLSIHLRKRVPSGAGLGGGSADAAVTLMGLDRMYDARLASRLPGLLAEIGSDAPFFALGGRAVAVERGTRVFPLSGGPGWCVIVTPPIHVATAEAYSWLTELPESNTILGFCACFEPSQGVAEPGPDARLNDFEAPLFHRFPELAVIKGGLVANGARFAALTGSGSAVFGWFDSRSGAERAAAAIRGAAAEAEVAVAPAMSRPDYFRRMFEG